MPLIQARTDSPQIAQENAPCEDLDVNRPRRQITRLSGSPLNLSSINQHLN